MDRLDGCMNKWNGEEIDVSTEVVVAIAKDFDWKRHYYEMILTVVSVWWRHNNE